MVWMSRVAPEDDVMEVVLKIRRRCNGVVRAVECGGKELNLKDCCRRFQSFEAENWNEERSKEAFAFSVVRKRLGL